MKPKSFANSSINSKLSEIRLNKLCKSKVFLCCVSSSISTFNLQGRVELTERRREWNSSSMINDPLTAPQKCVCAPLRRSAPSVAHSSHFILSFIVIFLILVLFPIFPFLALPLRCVSVCVCLCLLFFPVCTTSKIYELFLS